MATYDWSTINIVDGWTLEVTGEGKSITAQFYAATRAAFPARGTTVPSSGTNAAPSGTTAFRVAEIRVTPLSGAGPFVAEITARPRLGSVLSTADGSLLNTATFVLDTQDYSVPKKLAKNSGKYPYSVACDPRHCGHGVHLLVCTATIYVRKTQGIGSWGTFYGVVPKSSFPTWLSDLPGGNDRWRLDKEEIELMKDNDGSTDIYRVTRRLLGIPDGFIDKNGNRMEWDDSAIGQRSWDDL